jgi:SSS family solute:Na+ symporter
LLVIVIGFTALLAIPGLKDGDLAFLELVNKTYPSWFMGFVGAAGAVTAMVPSAILVLFASTLLAKNVYQSGFNPRASEEKVMRLSRFMVLAITTMALIFAFTFEKELVYLLIFGYDGVTQFFPGVVLGLVWRRVTKKGVITGMLVGLAIVYSFIATGRDPFLGMNVGFFGLIVNCFVTVAVSLMTRPKTIGFK